MTKTRLGTGRRHFSQTPTCPILSCCRAGGSIAVQGDSNLESPAGVFSCAAASSLAKHPRVEARTGSSNRCLGATSFCRPRHVEPR